MQIKCFELWIHNVDPPFSVIFSSMKQSYGSVSVSLASSSYSSSPSVRQSLISLLPWAVKKVQVISSSRGSSPIFLACFEKEQFFNHRKNKCIVPVLPARRRTHPNRQILPNQERCLNHCQSARTMAIFPRITTTITADPTENALPVTRNMSLSLFFVSGLSIIIV